MSKRIAQKTECESLQDALGRLNDLYVRIAAHATLARNATNRLTATLDAVEFLARNCRGQILVNGIQHQSAAELERLAAKAATVDALATLMDNIATDVERELRSSCRTTERAERV